MIKRISFHDFKRLQHDGEEWALIDVREQVDFGMRHQLYATCIPLSRLELMAGDLLPCPRTQIILTDAGDTIPSPPADRAAHVLNKMGYMNIAVLEGGVQSWGDAGLGLYSGLNVRSKAFGEYVLEKFDTPFLGAADLWAKVGRRENLVILDVRPVQEYEAGTIPGAINAPGADIVYHLRDTALDPATEVIVTCGGRTRSIIGAQTLINAGIPRRVSSLENGTLGWQLAGLELEKGCIRRISAITPEAIADARHYATKLAERFSVPKIDLNTLETWVTEIRLKTLYVIDVRLPEEYEKGHLEYVKNVPGGQLIQTTDEHLAVRNSRVVLVDDTEARATITASWLLQMGWTDVHVLEGGIGKESLVRGTRPQVLKDIHQADLISPVELKTLFDASERVLVLDLANSVEHRKGHIFGAFWTTRSNIYKVFSNMTLPEVLIITSPDNTLAHLAAGDFGAMWPKLAVKVLEGGTQAWKAAGMPTATGMAHPLSRENDVWIDDCERKDATKKDMLAYLLWEEALLEQVKREDEMFLN